MELLVAGFKVTKEDKDRIEKIFIGANQYFKTEIKPNIIDLRLTELPKPLPTHILCIGEATSDYIRPNEGALPTIVTIPKIKTFWEDPEMKAKVWAVIQGLFIDLQKQLLGSVKLDGLKHDRLSIDIEKFATKISTEEFAHSVNTLLEQNGPMLIECADGNVLHIYPKELPKKDKYEFTADEFITLMGAIFIFEGATKARLAKEG